MKNNENKEQYKLIWEVVALCVSIFALICVLCLAVLALFFPIPYAKVLQGVGLNNIALGVYEDVYKNSNNVNDGYIFLTESIYSNNSKYVIIAYEAFMQNENSSELLERVDNQNEHKFAYSAGLIPLCNERDYLTGKYVVALYQNNRTEDAFNLAKNDLNAVAENLDSITKDKSFLMFDFVNIANNEDLTLISLEIQQQMINFASKCEMFIGDFLIKLDYSLKDYSEALESAVKKIETYTALKILKVKGIESVLTLEQVESELNIANQNLNKILDKVATKNLEN